MRKKRNILPIGRNKCQISHRTDRHNHRRTSRKCGNFPINWEWKRALPNQASDPVAQRRGETHNFGRVWKLAGESHTDTRPGVRAAPTGGEEGPFFFTAEWTTDKKAQGFSYITDWDFQRRIQTSTDTQAWGTHVHRRTSSP